MDRPVRDSWESDPSPLTTQQIIREVAHVQELLTARLDALKADVDKEHENVVRVPTDVEKAVSCLRDVVNQQFTTTEAERKAINERISGVEKALEQRLHERDTRFDQAEAHAKDAVAAALSASKDASEKQTQHFTETITKSEVSLTKQIDALSEQLKQVSGGIHTQIDDLKERVGKVEGRELGVKEGTQTHQASVGTLLAVAGLVLSFVAIAIILIRDFAR